MKIMIDCGHYKNYNQSNVFKAYYEGNMTWKLGHYLKLELEKLGHTVGLTRSHHGNDLPVYDRGIKSKGYDLFLSLHSNWVDNEKTDRVIIFTRADSKQKSLAEKLGKEISKCMGISSKPQITTKTTLNGGEYYGVLRGCKAVNVEGLLIEHGFHSNLKTTKWLYEESNIKQLAKCEAKCIHDHYNKITTKDLLVKVKVDELNIRNGAGTSYKIVGTVSKGEVFTIVETKDNWGKLKSGMGWINISNSYCEKIKVGN